MNFIEEYKKGQEGVNKGLYMGDGLLNISRRINGVQRSRIYSVASPPKTGKSTFVDEGFVMAPYDHSLQIGADVQWLYYSLEIDRVSKEFDFAARYLYHDYKNTHVNLPEGVTKDGQRQLPMSPDYLRGRILDDENRVIKVSEPVFNALQETYERRIIPLFGEYDMKGGLIRPGKINTITRKNTADGIMAEIMNFAGTIGTFQRVRINGKEHITGYTPHNPEKYVIVIIDHMRKIIPQKGQTLKQAVDAMVANMVEMRNLLGFTFVPIIHTNRDLAKSDRIKFSKDELYPKAEDIKETGNLSEDSDYVFTMFNPNDDRYSLNSHFGVPLKDTNGNPLYPDLRTLHLVESRHCFYPLHFKVNMFGNLKTFGQLNL